MFTIGRQREKQHAARYVCTEADKLVVERVVDAAHDLLEGVAQPDTVAPILAEAFVIGGSGAWEQTGSWLRKLTRDFPSMSQVWLQVAPHKSARIRFRVAAFLNDMPDDIRRQLTAAFLDDASAKVRSKTAGEISMQPKLDVLPFLQSRVAREKDADVIYSIKDALAAYSTTAG